MNYVRVIPRDLFNEAKLLECVGQLCLLIHDGKCAPLQVVHSHPEQGFCVGQNKSDGSVYVMNLDFYVPKGPVIPFNSPLNSRQPYPLLCNDENDAEIAVFYDNGVLSAEFLQYLKWLGTH